MGLLVTPPADFTKSVAARQIPFFASPGNANMPLQNAMWSCRLMSWGPSGAAGGNLSGNQSALTAQGTFTVAAASSTNAYTAQRRGTYKTVVTTQNQQVGIQTGDAAWWRGNAAGLGGFLFACRFGFDAWTAGDRLFVGLANGVGALTTSDPSATLNMFGFGIDAGDTAITFMHNDGSGTATKDTISSQPTLATNQGYAAYIFAKPNDTIIYYRLDDFNAGTTIIDSSTNTDLPATTIFMEFAAVTGNAANTAAGAANIGISDLYVESDV